ncbi:MAG: hypothetical protein WA964_16650, partial [Ilumatobacter sp.]|uniref:hypothetical protein n=1 Tax=Ilumatobacter sp. TaxID=1967498 RepID=UPI003C714F21
MDFGPDVVFDYTGSLDVARRLWALADRLGTEMTARETARGEAEVGFVGKHAGQLVDRVAQERTDVDNAIIELRSAADTWALAWKDAIDQQNRNRYARAYTYSENNQGLIGHLDGVERPP